MGNVELMELKTSLIQCPSCPHYFFEVTILCQCGKHMRSDLDMIRRIKAAFEFLKAPCFRTSAITARDCKYGPNLWQEHHHKAKDALKAKEIFRRSGTDGKMLRTTGSPSLSMIGRMLG